jgi:hypothetical protein
MPFIYGLNALGLCSQAKTTLMRTFIVITFFVIFAVNAQAQNTLKLTFPNGEEIFPSGKDTIITWSGIPLSDTVKIEYSTDAGSSWNFITDTATGGKYTWKVPALTSSSNKCLVKADQISTCKPQWTAQIAHTGFSIGYGTVVDALEIFM